jgi:hypothetical protein
MRGGALRQGRQGIGGDVEREVEAFAGRREEVLVEFLLLRECQRVDEEVESPFFADGGEKRVHFGIVADVAGEKQRRVRDVPRRGIRRSRGDVRSGRSG